jgi:catechol 2,3-dioxygenase-like lactoylglutathione lyase family enzyme
MKITSQITFLYFEDYDKGCHFLGDVLGLEVAYDPGWAKVYRSTGDAYLGAVKSESGSIDSSKRGGTLISLTVRNVDELYPIFKEKALDDLSEIKFFDDIGLKSFFFKGPEGYDFEIQEFINEDLRALF